LHANPVLARIQRPCASRPRSVPALCRRAPWEFPNQGGVSHAGAIDPHLQVDSQHATAPFPGVDTAHAAISNPSLVAGLTCVTSKFCICNCICIRARRSRTRYRSLPRARTPTTRPGSSGEHVLDRGADEGDGADASENTDARGRRHVTRRAQRRETFN
jgi:hypothetical protein